MDVCDGDVRLFDQDVKSIQPHVVHLEDSTMHLGGGDCAGTTQDVEMTEDVVVKQEANTLCDDMREASADSGTFTRETRALAGDLLQRYKPADIFCVGVTGLFFKCLPSKMRHLLGEKCVRGELNHERFTLLLSTNLDGSEKLPLLCVGSPDNGKYLRDVNFEPINYKRNLRSWITAKIFNKWLRRLDSCFRSQGRQVVFLVNDCFDGQVSHVDLCAINLILMPTNESGRCESQPCDQGIIRQFKVHYRYNLVKQYIAHLEYCDKYSDKDQGKFEWSIADAFYTLRKSWGDVEAHVIQDAFDSAGLCVPQELDNLTRLDVEERFLKLMTRLNSILTRKISPIAYLMLDVDLSTRKMPGRFSDGQCMRYFSNSLDPPAFPTLAEAKKALNIVKRFAEKNFDQKGNYNAFHKQVESLEELIDSSALKGPRQSSVLEYFEASSWVRIPLFKKKRRVKQVLPRFKSSASSQPKTDVFIAT